MVMPEMNGEAVYEKLKNIKSDVKVLLASGYKIDDGDSKILDSDGNGFIQKPFDLIELSLKIKEVLG